MIGKYRGLSNIRVSVFTNRTAMAKIDVLTGRLAQLVRALASHARGHWFKSSIAHFCG